jgi:hypothetical protein
MVVPGMGSVSAGTVLPTTETVGATVLPGATVAGVVLPLRPESSGSSVESVAAPSSFERLDHATAPAARSATTMTPMMSGRRDFSAGGCLGTDRLPTTRQRRSSGMLRPLEPDSPPSWRRTNYCLLARSPVCWPVRWLAETLAAAGRPTQGTVHRPGEEDSTSRERYQE